MMLRLLFVLRSHKKLILWTLLLLFFQTLGSLYIPTLTADIINIGVAKEDIGYILKTGSVMVGVAGGVSVCAIFAAYLSSRIASYAGRDLRIQLFSKAQSLSTTDFETIGSSSMITRSNADIIQIQQAVLFIFQFLLPVPFMVLSGLILGFAKDPMLSWVLIVLMVVFIIYGVLIGKQMIPITRKMQLQMDEINRTLLERLSGVRVIRAFHQESYEKDKFTSTASNYADIAISLNKVYAVTYAFVMIMMNMIIVLFLWLGGVRVSEGFAKIGDIIAFIEYATLILSTLNMGIMTVIFMFRAQVCANRVLEVQALSSDDDSEVLGEGLSDSCESIEFRNVSFGYGGAEEAVLQDLNFTAYAGETTAIIGGTGCGKTTIMKLITGFHTISKGEIRINGKSIASYSKVSLRSKIGMTPQKAFLFAGTMEENLRYGKKDASLEELHHAVQVAQMQSFIEEHPEGYQFMLTQEGNNLSGGQKQRLAIARTIIKQADIYLFDDSFSALDYQTDKNLRKALVEEVKHKITIMVSQRIRSIQDADQIIVLDEGKIVGIGKHHELLHTCSIYQQIAASQLSIEGEA